MRDAVLQQLYEMYGREIYLYLYALSGNRETAGELCQETFLKALLALSERHGNMRAWLYLVARNLYFNYRKRERKKVSFLEEGVTTVNRERVYAPDVLDELLCQERNQMLYRALVQLSEQKREIIVLQYFAGWHLKEIAAFLGLSPENTRVLAHRARQEMKQFMEVNGYDLS